MSAIMICDKSSMQHFKRVSQLCTTLFFNLVKKNGKEIPPQMLILYDE